MNPSALGAATYEDFLLFGTLVTGLNGGGVYVNVGSAVLLPEVFLKVLSASRNMGHTVESFTTVNFDFLQHYRPQHNVLIRPHQGISNPGKGVGITGHHELMIPLLAASLLEAEVKTDFGQGRLTQVGT